jgi:methionyl-tRNA formyltransferase
MGALNMHGSLVPRFRGRAPVNWAVLHGERLTGASLHYMVEKPDAGDLVSQSQVPILPVDTAHEVFAKVTVAAEIALWQVLPKLLEGTAPRIKLDLGSGSYFGGRKPEDGLIHWHGPGEQIHNLIRAVAPPYPGAFGWIDGQRIGVGSSRVIDTARSETARTQAREPVRLFTHGDRVLLQCSDGGVLWLRELRLDGQAIDAAGLAARLRLPRDISEPSS